jgi:hypothetical protein
MGKSTRVAPDMMEDVPEEESISSFQTQSSAIFSATAGQNSSDIIAAKGGNDLELGILKFEGNKSFYQSHQSKADLMSLVDPKVTAGKKRLESVDKMLFSTTTPENPMVINTILIMKGQVPMVDMKNFLFELAMTHPRLRMKIVDEVWKPADLDLDDVVQYHRCPPDTSFIKYIDKKKLLSNQIDTSKFLWEWHGILTNEGNHVFLARLHHVIGDGMSLVNMVINLFDSEVGEEIRSSGRESGVPGSPKAGNSEQPPTEALKENSPEGAWVTPTADAKISPTLPPPKQTATVGAANIRKRKKPNCFQLMLYYVTIVISFPFVLISIAFMRDDPDNCFRAKIKEVPKKLVYTKAGKVSDLKFIGRMFGGTINDVISAILAGAMRKYQFEKNGKAGKIGRKISDMTLIIPISTRDPEEKGVVLNNQVASVFLKLPVSEPDLKKRFKKTKRRMDRLKFGPSMPILIFLIRIVLAALPSRWGRYFQEKYASKATMIFSNVPGPRQLRKIRGCEIRAMFGFVPLVGFQQAGFACFSYAGRISLSMMANPTSVPDPERFCEIYREELAAYQRLAHDINNKDKKTGKTGRRHTVVEKRLLATTVHELAPGETDERDLKAMERSVMIAKVIT